MNNQKKYNTYRNTFPLFVYDNYTYDVLPDGLHISFLFSVRGVGAAAPLQFSPTAFIPARPFLCFDQPATDLDALVFNIGMAEMVSYWKAFCPPRVEVRCGSLSDSQVAFWKKLYFNGLGEFFYTNGIHATLDDFLTIQPASDAPAICCQPHAAPNTQSRYLIPVGGGKDSVVTLELLSDLCRRTTAPDSTFTRPIPLIMNPRGATTQCVARAGYSLDDVLVIHRTIHPLLLELNGKGALNGHTPFSAMLAFYTLLASRLAGIANVALSNEGSANESTVLGTNVNHQYSKSLEFEDDFRAYVAANISPVFNYFSFLRPLSELQIAMLFARYPHYFDVFKSCNVGSKQDVWCGHCAKCLFAYIILAPFIEPERLNVIFGKNMLDDDALRPLFLQLTGQAPTKPFECVGTVAEVHTALALTLRRHYPSQPPSLLQGFVPAATLVSLCDLDNEGHNLAPDEWDILRSAISTQDYCE